MIAVKRMHTSTHTRKFSGITIELRGMAEASKVANGPVPATTHGVCILEPPLPRITPVVFAPALDKSGPEKPMRRHRKQSVSADRYAVKAIVSGSRSPHQLAAALTQLMRTTLMPHARR
jgi:hypothetical protein